MARHGRRKEKSLKVNFLMNVILTTSSFIFPLITFPYASRILLADGNGKINFANSVVSYFMLIASLGLPYYGVRACAVVRDDKQKLSRTVTELFIISSVTTVCSLLLLLGSIVAVPKFQEYKGLILILSCSIWLKTLGIEWLYQALEEYSYITLVSITFKFISVVLMFLLVHQHSDYKIYALITVISGSGSYILNFLRARRYISWVSIRSCNFVKHFKPILSFFVLSAAWSLYGNADSFFLGFLSTDEQNGYFGVVLKIRQMLLQCMFALSTVLLPRMANYYGNKRENDFYVLVRKNSSFMIIAGIAVAIFSVCDARRIILLLSGESFLPAVPVLQSLSMIVIVNGFSTVLGDNVLITQGKEKVTTLATLVGFAALTAVEFLLIPRYGAMGATVGTTVGIIVTVFIEIIYLRRSISLMVDPFCLIKCLASGVVACGVLLGLIWVTRHLALNVFVELVIHGIAFTVVYAGMLLITREQFVYSTLLSLLKRGR